MISKDFFNPPKSGHQEDQGPHQGPLRGWLPRGRLPDGARPAGAARGPPQAAGGAAGAQQHGGVRVPRVPAGQEAAGGGAVGAMVWEEVVRLHGVHLFFHSG